MAAVVNVDSAPTKETSHDGLVLSSEFYQPYLTTLSKSRPPNPIRSLYPLESTPGLISLLAGKPNGDTFPIKSLSISVRSPIDPSQEISLDITGDVLTQALQYGPTAGFPRLVEWITQLQVLTHGRPRSNSWRVSIGAGSQDVLYKALLALIEPGEPVFVQAPVYAGVVSVFQTLHCDVIEITADYDGISPSSLRHIINTWPSGKPLPKVLYTIPFGGNPSGDTTTEERRREILALAREFKFLILEDDPYYFLYFSDRPRPPSYFNLEAQDGGQTGLVLRFDSLSKVLSSGLRIGFVTGPVPLLQAIDLHTATANLQVSSTTQAITWRLLDYWGMEGFLGHTKLVAQFYRDKRDVFEKAMHLHMSGLAEWSKPEAGMFFWFKLLLPPSADAPDGDSEQLIRTKALQNGVLVLPGSAFSPGGRKSPYVRASFSLLSEEDVNTALRRLAEVVRKEIQPPSQ